MVMMDFEPAWVPDHDCPAFKRQMAGEIVEENHIKKHPVARARIYVCGGEKPTETLDSAQIQNLRRIWDASVVHRI